MEACYEKNSNLDATAESYWKAIRTRAGVDPDFNKTIAATDYTKEDDWAIYSAGQPVDKTLYNIRRERRCEFIADGMRMWDLKRWRLADKIWNGDSNNPSAQRRGLWPYLVVDKGDANHGKWVFFEKNMTEIYPYPLKFELRHYYGEFENGWLNNNPKLVKNPYQ